MSEEGRISVERRNHVLLIGIDRVGKRNAVTFEMYCRISRAYGELERDDDLRCGLLFAHGDHFTAGLDLTNFAPEFAKGKLDLPKDGLDPIGFHPPARTKPIVGVAQGICFTIGVELLLATDVRIASPTARFGQLEVKRGIYPVGGATVRLVREAGWGNAMRYLLTGDEFGAAEALRMGLVQEVAEAGKQYDHALELAERIAAQAPIAVRATLDSARRALLEGEEVAGRRLIPDLVPILKTEDAKEGIQSFLERRPAKFRGR